MSSEEAERNLENPVYGVPTTDADATEATYATPHDRMVTHYDMDTSYDTPLDADYHEIGSIDLPNSPLSTGQYDTTYSTIQ